MSRQTLKDATLTGVRWTMLARAASETVALAAAVALARLVPPAAFGRAAVALIFVPLAAILTFEGFASALVQRPAFDESHRRAANLMSLAGGAILSAATLLLAAPLAGPLFGAETASLVALVSPVFLLAAVAAVPRATLWRRLDFRRVGLIDVASLAAGSAVAVALAAAGVDAEAIVAGALAQTAARSLLLVAAAPPPRPRWHGRSQREIVAFGLPAALAGLVQVLFTNVDYAILAARLSAAQAGIYWRAFQLGVVYQDKISSVMMQLAFPVYSRTESREELRRLHQRATRVHAAVIFPLLALLIVLAPVLIPWLFGPAWEPAARPAQILAVAGMIAAALTGYPQVMLAVGRPQALLRFNVVMLVAYATAVAIAVGFGLIAVAVAVVGVYAGILVGVYRFLLRPHAGIPVRRLIGELGPAVAGCAVLIVVGFVLRGVMGGVGAPAPATLAAVGTGGLAAYAATLRALFSAVWADLRLLAEGVLPPVRSRARAAIAPGVAPADAPSGSSAS